MKFQNRVLAALSAVVLLLSTVTAAGAQVSGESSVAITANDATNVLIVTITTANFESRPFSFEAQTTLGTLTLQVSDTRGTASGWAVSLAGTDFRSPTESFAVTNLSVRPDSPSSIVAAGCPVVTSNANQPVVPISQMQTNTQRVWTALAGAGSGCFTLPATTSLVIPGGTLVGTYTSTITVSISSAP
jgi:hypothetical protein